MVGKSGPPCTAGGGRGTLPGLRTRGRARGLIRTDFFGERQPGWRDRRDQFARQLLSTAGRVYRESWARWLARQRKVLSFETAVDLDRAGRTLTIRLRDFRLTRAVEASDVGEMVEDVKRPTTGFDDVIGAGAAKEAWFSLWELSRGYCLRTFDVRSSGYERNRIITSVCLDGDGDYALLASTDRSIRLWRIPVRHFASAPWETSQFSTAEAASQSERLFDRKIKAARAALKRGEPGGALSAVRAARGVHGRERDRRALDLWHELHRYCRRLTLRDGWLANTFKGHTGWVSSVCFSPDGRHVISGSHDRTLRLWDVAGSRCLHTFEGHEDTVNSVVFSPSGRLALSASSDRTLRLWDVAGGKCLRTFEGHKAGINSVVFSPDGRYALSASSDRTVRLWRTFRTLQGVLEELITIFSP